MGKGHLPCPSSLAIYSPVNHRFYDINCHRLSCKLLWDCSETIKFVSTDASTTHVTYPQDRIRYVLIVGSLERLPTRCSYVIANIHTPESDGTAQSVQSQGGLATKPTNF